MSAKDLVHAGAELVHAGAELSVQAVHAVEQVVGAVEHVVEEVVESLAEADSLTHGQKGVESVGPTVAAAPKKAVSIAEGALAPTGAGTKFSGNLGNRHVASEEDLMKVVKAGEVHRAINHVRKASVVGEITKEEEDSQMAHLTHKAMLVVVQAHAPTIKLVEGQLEEMRTRYPMIMRTVQTMYACNMVLRSQRHAIERSRGEGEVTQADAERLMHEVNKKIKELYLQVGEASPPPTAS